jgi:hypothetical protein
MSCEKNGVSFKGNTKLNEYYSALTEEYDKNSNSIEKMIDFPKYAPTPAIYEFVARYELVKLIKDMPGDIFEMGFVEEEVYFPFFTHSHYWNQDINLGRSSALTHLLV